MTRLTDYGPRSTRRSAMPLIASLGAFLLVCFCVVITTSGSQLLNEQEVEGVVTDRYIQRIGQEDTFFVGLIKDNGETIVLANKDAWIRGKTNSADVQQQIQPGKRYRLKVVGFRFTPFSWFPNIIGVTLLPDTKKP